MSITQFLFSLTTSTIGLFKKSTRFFKFVLEGVGTTFGDTELFTGIITGTLFFFEGSLDVLELLLVTFDILLGLSISLQN
jgi:hypothetical protein